MSQGGGLFHGTMEEWAAQLPEGFIVTGAGGAYRCTVCDHQLPGPSGTKLGACPRCLFTPTTTVTRHACAGCATPAEIEAAMRGLAPPVSGG